MQNTKDKMQDAIASLRCALKVADSRYAPLPRLRLILCILFFSKCKIQKRDLVLGGIESIDN